MKYLYAYHFKIIIRCLFYLTFSICVIVAVFANMKRNHILDMSDSMLGYGYIAHGGGRIGEIKQSNTFEAVMNSINSGCKFIELDLLETSDHQFIASHDWTRLRQAIYNSDKSIPVPYSSFYISESKLYGKYKIISVSDINKILQNYPDIFVFTDQTTNYGLINSLGWDQRLFVETFNIFNYVSALFYGIKRPMLNVDAGKSGVFVSLFSYILLNPKYVTVNLKTAQNYPWFLRLMTIRGVKLFIFTVNDPLVAGQLFLDYNATIYTDDLLYDCKK